MTHQPVNYLITTRSHIILSQPGHAFQLRDEACEIQASDPSRLTFQSGQNISTCQLSYRPCQPVNYVITAKPHIPLYSRQSHIILSQPGHAFQLRDEACEIQASDPSRVTFQSGQNISTCQLSYRPCQPVNYVITAKPHIPLYSRLSVKAMINDPSTCQLPYHSQTTHYLITARSTYSRLGRGLWNPGQWPITSHIPVRTVHVNQSIILSQPSHSFHFGIQDGGYDCCVRQLVMFFDC